MRLLQRTGKITF